MRVELVQTRHVFMPSGSRVRPTIKLTACHRKLRSAMKHSVGRFWMMLPVRNRRLRDDYPVVTLAFSIRLAVLEADKLFFAILFSTFATGNTSIPTPPSYLVLYRRLRDAYW